MSGDEPEASGQAGHAASARGAARPASEGTQASWSAVCRTGRRGSEKNGALLGLLDVDLLRLALRLVAARARQSDRSGASARSPR
jgi:hypothetical protein